MHRETQPSGSETLAVQPTEQAHPALNLVRSGRPRVATALTLSLALVLPACDLLEKANQGPTPSVAPAAPHPPHRDWQEIAEDYSCERNKTVTIRLVDADGKPTSRSPGILTQIQGAANMTCFKVEAGVPPKKGKATDSPIPSEAGPQGPGSSISVNPPSEEGRPWKFVAFEGDVPAVTLQLNNDGRPPDTFWKNSMRAVRACLDSVGSKNTNNVCARIDQAKQANEFPVDPNDTKLGRPPYIPPEE